MPSTRSVVQGRLVDNPLPRIRWGRTIVVAASSLALWLGNPANLVPTTSSSITNYGLFSLKRSRGNARSVHVLYQTFSIDNRFADTLWRPQKPLLWDDKDRPFTTHRVLVWTSLALGLVAFCTEHVLTFKSPDLHALTDNLVWPDPSRPIASTFRNILQANLLYSTWQRINLWIVLQHVDSIFRITSNVTANYLLAVSSWITGVAVVTLVWQGIFETTPTPSRWTAAGLGYCLVGRPGVYYSVPYFADPIPTVQMAWTLLAVNLCLSRSYISELGTWMIFVVWGMTLGEAHYQQTALMTTWNQVWQGVEQAMRSLFRM